VPEGPEDPLFTSLFGAVEGRVRDVTLPGREAVPAPLPLVPLTVRVPALPELLELVGREPDLAPLVL